MDKQSLIYIVAENLFYRDLAREHKWYHPEDMPFLDQDPDKAQYIQDAETLVGVLRMKGFKV